MSPHSPFRPRTTIASPSPAPRRPPRPAAGLRRAAATVAGLALALGLTACGDSDPTDAGGDSAGTGPHSGEPIAEPTQPAAAPSSTSTGGAQRNTTTPSGAIIRYPAAGAQDPARPTISFPFTRLVLSNEEDNTAYNAYGLAMTLCLAEQKVTGVEWEPFARDFDLHAGALPLGILTKAAAGRGYDLGDPPTRNGPGYTIRAQASAGAAATAAAEEKCRQSAAVQALDAEQLTGKLTAYLDAADTFGPAEERARARWVACMAAAGNTLFTSPGRTFADHDLGWNYLPFANPAYAALSPTQNVAMAAIDVQCKASTDLIETAAEARAAGQKAFIAAHEDRIAEFTKPLRDKADAAERYLRAHAADASRLSERWDSGELTVDFDR